MSTVGRDLSSPELWEASLRRSLERRYRRRSRLIPGRRSAGSIHAQPQKVRDLADRELWELSLGRSRARRRARELQFVPAGKRAKRLSLGTIAALAVGPTSSLGEATAATRKQTPPKADPPTTTEHFVTLQLGSSGAQVRKLQQELGIKVDGQFGPETESAVVRFQLEHNLEPDGIVGPKTGKALLQARTSGRKRLSLAQDVMLAQAALGVHVDGDFGPETEQAVRAFQAQSHIKVDGVIGPETWRALHAHGEGILVPPPSALPKPEPKPQPPARTASPAPTPVAHTAAVTTGGNPVRMLQEALHVAVDGEFGPETEAAVKRFQEAHGLTPDGIVGPETWAALGINGQPNLYPSVPNEQPVSDPQPGGGEEQAAPSGGAPQAAPEGSAPASNSTPTGGSGNVPEVVQRVIDAANEIATKPYIYGGGHGSWISPGYDCSGSVSYALHGGGLLEHPEDSTELESYGEPGPGKYITIYANAEHAYMVIDGRRFDTVALAEDGSRWSNSPGDDAGSFVVRHPPGL